MPANADIGNLLNPRFLPCWQPNPTLLFLWQDIIGRPAFPAPPERDRIAI